MERKAMELPTFGYKFRKENCLLLWSVQMLIIDERVFFKSNEV